MEYVKLQGAACSSTYEKLLSVCSMSVYVLDRECAAVLYIKRAATVYICALCSCEYYVYIVYICTAVLYIKRAATGLLIGTPSPTKTDTCRHAFLSHTFALALCLPIDHLPLPIYHCPLPKTIAHQNRHVSSRFSLTLAALALCLPCAHCPFTIAHCPSPLPTKTS